MSDANKVLLTKAEVLARTGLPAKTLATLIRRGSFPKPVALTQRHRRWSAAAVADWEARVAAVADWEARVAATHAA